MHGGLTHLVVHLLNRPEPIRQAGLLWVLASHIERPQALLPGLRSLVAGSKGRWSERIDRLSNALEQGYSLSDCLRMAGEVLPEETVLAVRVGESSGALKQVLLEEAKRILKSENGTRSLSIAWVFLMVGTFTLAVFVLVTGVKIDFLGLDIEPVVQRTVTLLEEFEAEVPLMMQPMIVFGNWLQSFGLFLILPLGTLFVASFFLLVRWRYRYISAGQLPFAHQVRRTWTPVILRSMAVSSTAGNPMSQCLHSLLAELRPGRVSQKLSAVRQQIDSGQDYCDALVAEGFLKSGESQFLKASRQSRHVDWALLQLADSIVHRGQIRQRLLRTVLQPCIVVVCGAIIFWVATTLLLPAVVLMERVSR